MTTEKTAAQTLGELLGYLLVFFLFPWFVMKGWEAIAWEFNLPQFGYWACFFISHGFRFLTGNLRRKCPMALPNRGAFFLFYFLKTY